ncbi:helix-turn-helix domain-containing protein [Brenneria tiliae]|uniref:helix-turn-helix domain-containing protein n=1 Tax=Brenneria tiliae TaxID=2914984 RepID=UPI002014E66D|nr:AraC family transcriptional regulator [Brenneria tiliae]MCL2898315.1 AraC family transcriptional regulator [Brenneria tiliae]MCL2902665.1 AraC family transcriptional regulator [Brenneria tiliae]
MNRAIRYPPPDNSCQSHSMPFIAAERERGAGSPSTTASSRCIGMHDREFTLFQVSGLLLTAQEQNSTQGLQRDLGIDLIRGEWPAATVSYMEMRQVFERLWLFGDRAELLFNHASRINFASFGTSGMAAMALRDRKAGIRFRAGHSRTPWNAVPENGHDGGMSLLHIPKFYDPEFRAAFEHFHFVNCFAVARSGSPGIRIADAVRFTRSCGISRSALEHYFGCPVYFDQDIAQIEFSRRWLDHPVPFIESGLRSRLARMLEEVLAGETTLRRQSILQFLGAHLDEIRSSEDLARLLGISRRTLARILDREGVNYSVLSREVRLTEARRMLRHGMSIPTIAENLGFADERSFRRAFLRWGGTSPSEYRRSSEQVGRERGGL